MTTAIDSGAIDSDTNPTWRAWVGLTLLALPLFVMATDYTVLFMAMTTIAADLTPSTTQMLWIMHIGEFVAAGLVITMGRLTDKVGRRRLLLLAMVLYGSASTLAALAPRPEVLIAARALAGISVTAASPAAFSMVPSMFTGARQIGIGFAVLMGAFSAGAALGPPLGGVLLEHFWWGAVFLIKVPIAIAVLTFGVWVLPRPAAATAARIDVISVALSMTAVILAVFGLQEIADKGLTLVYSAAVAAGVVLAVLFLGRQRRLADPLLDLSLFRIRALRVVASTFALASLAFVAVDFILIQHLQIVNGVPTARLLAAPGVAAIVATSLTPVLSRWLVPSHLMAVGMSVGLAGTAVTLITLAVVPQATAPLIVGTTILASGFTPLMVLGSAHRDLRPGGALRFGGRDPRHQHQHGWSDGHGATRQPRHGDLRPSASANRSARCAGDPAPLASSTCSRNRSASTAPASTPKTYPPRVCRSRSRPPGSARSNAPRSRDSFERSTRARLAGRSSPHT